MKLNLIRLGALATAFMLGCTEAISLSNKMTPAFTHLAQTEAFKAYEENLKCGQLLSPEIENLGHRLARYQTEQVDAMVQHLRETKEAGPDFDVPSYSTDDNVCPEYAALDDTPEGIIKQNELDQAYTAYFAEKLEKAPKDEADLEVNLGHFFYWLDVYEGKMRENCQTLEGIHGQVKKTQDVDEKMVKRVEKLKNTIGSPSEQLTDKARADLDASKRNAVKNQLMSYAGDLTRQLSRYHHDNSREAVQKLQKTFKDANLDLPVFTAQDKVCSEYASIGKEDIDAQNTQDQAYARYFVDQLKQGGNDEATTLNTFAHLSYWLKLRATDKGMLLKATKTLGVDKGILDHTHKDDKVQKLQKKIVTPKAKGQNRM